MLGALLSSSEVLCCSFLQLVSTHVASMIKMCPFFLERLTNDLYYWMFYCITGEGNIYLNARIIFLVREVRVPKLCLFQISIMRLNCKMDGV